MTAYSTRIKSRISPVSRDFVSCKPASPTCHSQCRWWWMWGGGATERETPPSSANCQWQRLPRHASTDRQNQRASAASVTHNLSLYGTRVSGKVKVKVRLAKVNVLGWELCREAYMWAQHETQVQHFCLKHVHQRQVVASAACCHLVYFSSYKQPTAPYHTCHTCTAIQYNFECVSTTTHLSPSRTAILVLFSCDVRCASCPKYFSAPIISAELT